jgi:hypothetical protein
MTTPAFPPWINIGTAAHALAQGYAEQSESNQATFQPETGAPILRRRMSISNDLVTFTARMSSNDFDDLIYFYENAIQDGTLQFTMPHPRTGTSATWAWVTGQPPKINQAYGLSFETVFTLRLISGGLLPINLGADANTDLGWDSSDSIAVQ